MGDYRQPILDHLRAQWGNGFHVYAGTAYFLPSSAITVDLPGSLTVVTNRFLFGRRLNWQRGVVAPLVRAEVAIVEFNPHVLSAWVILVARRCLCRKTVLWGHAWSRRGRDSPTDPIRHLMRRLSTTVLVYSERQRRELQARMPGKTIVVAPNAMYPRSQIGVPPAAAVPDTILYTGRLVSQKKPRLLVEAFARACELGLGSTMRLAFAGDGPEYEALRELVRALGLGDRVSLLGHVPPGDMREHYAHALVSASPGYVGLSLVQSLSYGVPMLIALDEPHSPEIEAARDGFNAIFVASDAIDEWARALITVSQNKAHWIALREPIAVDCAARYSVEAMAHGFASAVGFARRSTR